MADRKEKQPEEVEMMPKAGRIYEDEAHSEEECTLGSWRLTFLQKFSGPWTFTIVVGLASLVSEFMHLYLKTQLPMLRRLYEIDASTADWMVYSSEIACIVSVLFFCVVAKRIHIPRFLAISTLICGVVGILCIVPFLATRDDLVPAKRVLKNETYTLEKFMMMAPKCTGGPILMDSNALQSQTEDIRLTDPPPLIVTDKRDAVVPSVTKTEGLQLEPEHTEVTLANFPTTTSKPPPLPETETTTRKEPTTTTTEAKPRVVNVETIPDFKKLSTHPIYPQLVPMAKSMGIDLAKLVDMDLGKQIDYLNTLPPQMKAMLPNLKMMLGPNADSYFIKVDVDRKVIVSSRRKRSTGQSRTSRSSDEEKTMLMPDFKKLTTHEKYPMLVEMSKNFNIDLDALSEMNLDDQIEYVNKLPKNVRDMLPQLKGVLGENADSYFIHVKTGQSRTSSSSDEEKTMLMPDFKKLTTHEKYPMLVLMSKNFNIDLDALAEMNLDDQIEFVNKLPKHVKDMLPQLKAVLGENADSYFINVKIPASQKEKKIVIPDFKKLRTHPNYAQLSMMSKTMNVDLDKLAEMDLAEQLEYLDELPDHVKNMLPQLKGFLGENADSYFIEVTSASSSDESVNEAEMSTCMSMNQDIFEAIYQNICPFKTGPFLIDSSTGVLVVLNLAMVIQGIVRGPRLAFAVSFLDDNTEEKSTVLHLAILCGITFLGPAISLVLGFYTNSIYITDEDVGFMTFFNPRWLPAWWLGFVYLAVAAFIFTLPLIFFPKKLRMRPIKEYRNKIPRLNVAIYFLELGKTVFQLVTNPVYMSLLMSHLLSAFVWTGIGSILITYVTHQFSLEPMLPGVFLLLAFTFIGAIGIFIGGFIAVKFDQRPLGHLKLALGLACGLVIIQAFHLAFGCEQPNVDRGEKVLTNYTTSSCKCACQCIDYVYTPGCGSDGRTYYSPCHAGCTEAFDGQFHKCQCIEDDVQKLTPGYCPSCNLFYSFAVALCLGGLIVGIQFVPLLVATIRSVRPEQVPLAVGLRTMLLIAVVSIPSPLAFKAIQDSKCLSSLPECGIMDSCVMYDIEPFRFELFGISLGVEFLGALLLLVAFLIRRRLKSSYGQENGY